MRLYSAVLVLLPRGPEKHALMSGVGLYSENVAVLSQGCPHKIETLSAYDLNILLAARHSSTCGGTVGTPLRSHMILADLDFVMALRFHIDSTFK